MPKIEHPNPKGESEVLPFSVLVLLAAALFIVVPALGLTALIEFLGPSGNTQFEIFVGCIIFTTGCWIVYYLAAIEDVLQKLRRDKNTP